MKVEGDYNTTFLHDCKSRTSDNIAKSLCLRLKASFTLLFFILFVIFLLISVLLVSFRGHLHDRAVAVAPEAMSDSDRMMNFASSSTQRLALAFADTIPGSSDRLDTVDQGAAETGKTPDLHLSKIVQLHCSHNLCSNI